MKYLPNVELTGYNGRAVAAVDPATNENIPMTTWMLLTIALRAPILGDLNTIQNHGLRGEALTSLQSARQNSIIVIDGTWWSLLRAQAEFALLNTSPPGEVQRWGLDAPGILAWIDENVSDEPPLALADAGAQASG